MEIEIVSRDGEEVRIRAVADAEDMDRAYTDGLDAFVVEYGLDHLVGDTSYKKITNAFDAEEADQAIYSAVMNYLVPFVISEYGQAPLATYGITAEDGPEKGKPFTFELTLLEKPHFELSSYEPVTVKVQSKPEVTESDIDQQIQILVRQVAAAQQGLDTDSNDVVMPALTDAWVKENLVEAQVSTVDELREVFRKTSEEELANRYEQAKMNAAMNEYVKRFTGTVSDKMLSAMTQELYETFLAELAREGVDFDSFSKNEGLTEEQVRDSLSKQAENQLIQGFVLDAIFEHEAITLEPTDLIQALRNIAPGKEEDTFDAMQKSGRGFLLKQSAQRMKAAQWISENTTFITE